MCIHVCYTLNLHQHAYSRTVLCNETRVLQNEVPPVVNFEWTVSRRLRRVFVRRVEGETLSIIEAHNLTTTITVCTHILSHNLSIYFTISVFVFRYAVWKRTSFVTHTLSCWDFAGQEEFYSKHEYFLSNRAVYLVCINLGEYLLHLIHIFSFHFPL